ncbi:MAG: sigma 54-interacting transcriptional regulator [Nitrospirales bacterium]
MAGSYSPREADIPDPVQMRIEGLKLLAHHLDEPIAILNPQMELVYANPSVNQLAQACPLIPLPSICPSDSEIFGQPPCDPCPATQLFNARDQRLGVSSNPLSYGESPAMCPLPRAVPIRGETGAMHFAVLMGARGGESVVAVSKADEPPFRPAQVGFSVNEATNQTIIGESEPIQRLVEMIQLVAASEASVLIQGESGTGKELVAKTIHALSRRRAHPFIVVECSALPETLLESELFGHVRGAFTGAVVDRKGLFEEAEGGTIFLDEIVDTTPAFQARLLRVLQEGEIKPVGSNQSIKVNVRVLSAGNKPLEALVKAKTFRADLYYRLAVLPLTVPALRERKEDIPLLVEHFLRWSVQKHGRVPMSVSSEAQLALEQHQWPGNVRELENVIERGVVTCRHSILGPGDLFVEHKGKEEKNDLNLIGKVARQEAERSQILQALRDAKRDKTRAARLLNISRSSLYNKLRDYNIS